MIDREARDRAAVLLRRFAAGEITNEDFHADRPWSRQDPALRAIFDRVWLYYSDLKTHRLEGEHALDPEARALFLRCELFLQSDLEYEYPNVSSASVGRLLATVLSLGLYRFFDFHQRRYESLMKAAGDMEVWPFLSRPYYEAAMVKLGEKIS